MMDEYQELMGRHAAIFARWMEYVEAAKQIYGEDSREFYSAGITLDKRGGLRMQGRDRRGAIVLELEMKPGDVVVNHTYEAPWISHLL